MRQLAFALQSFGISRVGAEAALSGLPIWSAEDRARLAGLTAEILGAEKPPAFWLLTKSPGANRNASGFDCAELVQWAHGAAPVVIPLLLQKLTRTGITPLGARQILAGLAVTNPADRNVYAVWLTVGFFEVTPDNASRR